MPLFSIVVGTYRHKATLPKLAESFGAQTFKDFEVHICDDGSGDGTVELAELLMPDAEIHVQPHRGMRLAKNLNRGIRAAKGDYCLFVMGDSFLEVDYLETLAKWMTGYRAVCGVRIQTDGTKGVDIDWRLKKSAIPQTNCLLSGRVWAMTTGNGLCVPTSFLKETGGLDERFEGYGGEDTELVMRLFFSGHTVWSVPDLKLYHHWHKEQPTDPKNTVKIQKLLEQKYGID